MTERERRLNNIQFDSRPKSMSGFAISFSEYSGMRVIVSEDEFDFLISELRAAWAREKEKK